MANINSQFSILNSNFFGPIFLFIYCFYQFCFLWIGAWFGKYAILNSHFLIWKFETLKRCFSTYFTVCHSSVFYYFTVPNTSLLFQILLHSRKSKLDVEQQTTTNTKTLTYLQSITTPPIAKIRTTIVIGRKFYTGYRYRPIFADVNSPNNCHKKNAISN